MWQLAHKLKNGSKTQLYEKLTIIFHYFPLIIFGQSLYQMSLNLIFLSMNTLINLHMVVISPQTPKLSSTNLSPQHEKNVCSHMQQLY
jgi:hypothetical protein